MSRESKIGLLVTVAFILVIGLLLSDHVTVATRAAPAPLAGTVAYIDGGLRVPGVVPQPVVLPSDPTRGEAFVYQPAPAPPAPVQAEMPHIDVRLGAGPTPVVATGRQAVGDGHDPVWDNAPVTPEVANDSAPAPTSTLQAVADAGGEPVVRSPSPAPPAAERPVAVVAYVAQRGDTLGHLAARAYGRSTSESRAKIVALNPSLSKTPDLIVVGRTYNLPVGVADVASAAAAPATPAPTPKPAAPRTYVVKGNDSLWQIAARVLGDGSRHGEIVRLNPELSNPDTLEVGMTLNLPPL